MNSRYPHSLLLGSWLLFCAVVVYVMIVVGGITRLTQSGLSMVEWAPVMGILPPMGEVAWLETFAKYQAFPEYQKVNVGMTLGAFKNIFWWEYSHRILGRVIGLIYFVPFIIFLLRGMIPSHWRLRLFGLFLLGGLQGLMGWYMVKSGLVDVPHVSQYRLTAHLGLALIIFICMFWYALDFLRSDTARRGSSYSRNGAKLASSGYLRLTAGAVCIVFLMMLSGGFVAGTKAGFIMNTFPTMNGEWLPHDWLAMTPLWRNLFENPVTIQLVHRFIAVLVTMTVIALFVLAIPQRFKTFASLILLVMCLQVTLGISALLMKVPVVLGAAHQAGAVALLAASLFVAHVARKASS